MTYAVDRTSFSKSALQIKYINHPKGNTAYNFINEITMTFLNILTMNYFENISDKELFKFNS